MATMKRLGTVDGRPNRRLDNRCRRRPLEQEEEEFSTSLSCCCRRRGFLRFFLVLLLLIRSSAEATEVRPHRRPNHNHCEPVNFDWCRDMPYNETTFPNLAGAESQKEAARELRSFNGLLLSQCSDRLKFFLCSVNLPMCSRRVAHQPIGPCRPLCLHVRRRCLPILQQFNLDWPPSLDCDNFPTLNSPETMCMRGPTAENGGAGDESSSRDDLPLSEEARKRLNCANKRMIYLNDSGECALLCRHDGRYFSDSQHSWAVTLTWLPAILLAVTAGSAVAVCLLVNQHVQFQYPQVALLFQCCCYAPLAALKLLSLLLGDSLSCVQLGASPSAPSVFVSAGLHHTPCSAVAILVYFAEGAAKFWWLLLCWFCYLTNRRRWSRQMAGARLNTTAHALAWGLPAAGVLAQLASQAIDADPLSGLCSVGQQSAVADDELGRRSALNGLVFVAGRDILLFVAGAPALFGLLFSNDNDDDDDKFTPEERQQQTANNRLRQRQQQMWQQRHQEEDQNIFSVACCAAAVANVPVLFLTIAATLYGYLGGTESGSVEVLILGRLADNIYSVLVSVLCLLWISMSCMRSVQPRLKHHQHHKATVSKPLTPNRDSTAQQQQLHNFYVERQ